MKIMSHKICLLVCLGLSNCAVVDSSNFKYLGEDSLELRPMMITGAEQDVEISLPKSLSINIPKEMLIESDRLELPYTKVLDFPYEWLWGGPAHKDKGLYLFELGLERREGSGLLDNSVESRIQIHRDKYEAFDKGTWRDVVLGRFSIERYQSSQGDTWLIENMPTVTPHHEVFSIPLSNNRELVVWFWYNEDWVKDHPDWFERRKALSRRILDTVKLTKPN
jgi:hypothetical protein